MVGGCAEGSEEVEELRLLCLADTLEVEDLAEVGVGFVGNVDEVGLDERFGRRRADLQRLEQGIDF